MSKRLLTNVIVEEGQQLNAIKRRIQNLEDQLRVRNPSYTSTHGLPTLTQMHSTRAQFILDACRGNRSEELAKALSELRQLARVRGMRSQIRTDPGSWWEVADDLEAGLNRQGQLAKAVACLPHQDGARTSHFQLDHAPLAGLKELQSIDDDDEDEHGPAFVPAAGMKFEILIPVKEWKAAGVEITRLLDWVDSDEEQSEDEGQLERDDGLEDCGQLEDCVQLEDGGPMEYDFQLEDDTLMEDGALMEHNGQKEDDFQRDYDGQSEYNGHSDEEEVEEGEDGDGPRGNGLSLLIS